MLAQVKVAFSMCGQRANDAVYGHCSTVQTLYIFYYYIVVYIYCMRLSGPEKKQQQKKLKKNQDVLWSSFVGYGN